MGTSYTAAAKAGTYSMKKPAKSAITITYEALEELCREKEIAAAL